MSITHLNTMTSSPVTLAAASLLVACVCAHASPATRPATAASSQAPDLDVSVLQQATHYAEFRAGASASGWLPENALRAGSCVAAGDCEMVFGRARRADRLNVHIGTDDDV